MQPAVDDVANVRFLLAFGPPTSWFVVSRESLEQRPILIAIELLRDNRGRVRTPTPVKLTHQLPVDVLVEDDAPSLRRQAPLGPPHTQQRHRSRLLKDRSPREGSRDHRPRWRSRRPEKSVGDDRAQPGFRNVGPDQPQCACAASEVQPIRRGPTTHESPSDRSASLRGPRDPGYPPKPSTLVRSPIRATFSRRVPTAPLQEASRHTAPVACGRLS